MNLTLTPAIGNGLSRDRTNSFASLHPGGSDSDSNRATRAGLGAPYPRSRQGARRIAGISGGCPPVQPSTPPGCWLGPANQRRRGERAYGDPKPWPG